MTETEKLVEAINEFFGCDAAYYDVNPFDLATHLIAKGVTLDNQVSSSEWISVKDRLPEEWKTVLVFIPSIDAIIPAKLRGGSWYATWDTTRLEYVSCWMPMPEKPNPLKGE